MTHELQHKHRPQLLKEVIGQEAAVKQLQRFLKMNTLPHAILFAGGSGTGKTTLARILKIKLNCADPDFCEMNAAEARGIDTVREIQARVRLAPAIGACRVWLIDECHRLTNDSMSALLKVLEDVPRHVYFFLCTTDPQKILQAIRTRCTLIKLDPLSPADLIKLLTSIASKEDVKIGLEVIEKIVDVSEGSAREAVKRLNAAIHLESDEDRIKAIEDPVAKRQAFDLVKLLVYERQPTWTKAVVLLKSVEVGNRESFRHFVLACARTELLKANHNAGRAWTVIDICKTAWYNYEEVGLEHAVFEVCREISGGK